MRLRGNNWENDSAPGWLKKGSGYSGFLYVCLSPCMFVRSTDALLPLNDSGRFRSPGVPPAGASRLLQPILTQWLSSEIPRLSSRLICGSVTVEGDRALVKPWTVRQSHMTGLDWRRSAAVLLRTWIQDKFGQDCPGLIIYFSCSSPNR